jgi:hypothetical protein
MKTTLGIAALVAVLVPMHAFAQSTELVVTGKIVPTACVPAFAGGGTVDLGGISSTTLSPTAQTELMPHEISLTITCDAPAAVAIRVIDNRSATTNDDVMIDGMGRANSRMLGIGSKEGKNIGGYALRRGVPLMDGVPATLLNKHYTSAWFAEIRSLVAIYNAGGNYTYSWGASEASGPGMGTVHTFPMSVVPVITRTSDLPALTSEIPLDGSATFEVVYL